MHTIQTNDTTKNIVLFSFLKELLATLNNANLKIILLKGAALVPVLYYNISKRQIRDIDILVQKKDLSFLIFHIKALGFEEFNKNSCTFVRKDKIPIFLDIHTNLKHLDSLSEHKIWNNAESVVIEGEETFTLLSEHSLPFLISHATLSHGYANPKWLKDII